VLQNIIICRFRFPKKLVLKVYVDAYGILHLPRNNHMINPWNPVIASTLRSNHDISFIPSQSKTLASVFYMTNYATKDDIKLHQVVMMAAVLRLTEEATSSNVQEERAQKLDWSKFALRLYNRFAREREISGVAIANHILQQPALFLPLGEQRKVNINLFWVKFEVSRVACLSRASEVPDSLEQTSQDQYSTFTTTRHQPYTLYDNYRYRGNLLVDVCFYEYCCQVQVLKLERTRTSDIRFDQHHPNYHSICQRVAEQRRALITPSIYGKISDLENTMDSITGEYQNTGPIWNDHCQVLLGLFIPWEELPALFEEYSSNYKNPMDACSYIWNKIKDVQPPHIQRLADNVALLRKSKEDADADKFTREQEILDFDDIAYENTIDTQDDTDIVLSEPRVMSKSELFSAYIEIRAKWQSEAEKSTTSKRHQSLDLNVESLTPLRTSFLKADDSLSYFDDSVLDTWKLEFKHLRQSRSDQQRLDLEYTYDLREEDEDAIYEPRLVPATDYAIDIEHTRIGLGANPSIDDLFPCVNGNFNLNEKQSLIVRNVLKSVLRLDCSRQTTVTESDQQFLLYVGGCGGTGKTQIIKAILLGLDLLNIKGSACVTASTGVAAAHIAGQTIHSAVGITTQETSHMSVAKLSTLQNLLRGTGCFIVDEISMVSTKLLGQVNQYCTRIFELPTTGSAVFGGVPIVLLFGDFYQFPPVAGDPLWTLKPASHFTDIEREGWNTWRKFNNVIMLTESLRQQEDKAYQELLIRARDVCLTQEDVDTLNTCTIQNRKAKGETLPPIAIVTRNKLRHELNRMQIVDFARERHQKVYVFAATHHPIARKSTSKKTRTLFGDPAQTSFSSMLEMDDGNSLKGSGLLLFTKDMPVMCLSNVCTPSGVVNGMRGTAIHAVPDPTGKYHPVIID
jgi:hypothetical protein